VILYVNGDSHSQGAMPTGLSGAGFVDIVAKTFNLNIHNDADAASSVPRVIRTTREYFSNKNNSNSLVLIGWGTWEREEWEHNGKHYNIMDSWYKHLPEELIDRYHNWINNNSPEKLEKNSRILHEEIYQLHQFFQESNIPHLFFNCMYNFFGINEEQKKDWNNCYLDPYDNNSSYYWYLHNQGYVSDKWYHFGPDGHAAWAKRLIDYIQEQKII
jgi:hypothetical protein